MSDHATFYLIGATEVAARPLEPALYLVATPIGNLSDITLRALETLAACDVLACEDTRVTRVLLDRYGIRRRPLPYHEHNAAEAGPRLLAQLEDGKSVALVSDAGTPLISDPGYRLVTMALEKAIRVVPVPGPCAPIAALTMSGLPSDAFLFGGFLPVREGQRRTRIEMFKSVQATLIFFESPRRLADSLTSMAAVLGAGRRAVVTRELTKMFEEARAATLGELAAHYRETGAPKGEIVVCVSPPEAASMPAGEIDRLLLSLAAEMPSSRAAAQASHMTGEPKTELYRRLVALKAGIDSDG